MVAGLRKKQCAGDGHISPAELNEFDGKPLFYQGISGDTWHLFNRVLIV